MKQHAITACTSCGHDRLVAVSNIARKGLTLKDRTLIKVVSAGIS